MSSDLTFDITNVFWPIHLDVYLKPCQTSIPYKNRKRLKAVNYFHKKAPSYIFWQSSKYTSVMRSLS